MVLYGAFLLCVFYGFVGASLFSSNRFYYFARPGFWPVARCEVRDIYA